MTQSPLYQHFRDWPAALWHWPHFTAAEMACKGDGSLMLDTVAMDRLEALRVYLGAPFVILSAYRSPAHNAAVGGAPHSQHLQGRAFDISMRNHDPREFEAAARAYGFHGIGQYPTGGQAHASPFMHIDTRPDAAAWTIPPDARWPIFEDEALPHSAQAKPLAAAAQAGAALLSDVVGTVAEIATNTVAEEIAAAASKFTRRIGGRYVTRSKVPA